MNMEVSMNNNIFYSRNENLKTNNKISFKEKKEKTLSSLKEVENFLFNYKHFIKYIKLYKLFK